MTESQKARALTKVLPLVAVIFIFGLAPLMRFWSAGWQWQPNQAEYEQMFQGMYATLGVFLLLASRAPARHRSLILFAGWSSVIHAVIMGIQALRDTAERGHLIGDVPALALVGLVLVVLAPAAQEATRSSAATLPKELEPQGT